jgi:hypothetical protein
MVADNPKIENSLNFLELKSFRVYVSAKPEPKEKFTAPQQWK